MGWLRKIFGHGYDAAEDSRHQPRLTWGRQVGKDEDAMIGAYDREKLRLRCRNLYRNDSITRGVVGQMSKNVVGSGIIPQAKTSSPEWNDVAEAFFREWSKVSDLRQRIDLPMMQRIAVEERIISGDFGFVLTSGGQLQPIEGERIVTPAKMKGKGNVVDGVKIDPKTGITLGYFVFGRDDSGKVDNNSTNYDFIPRENFIFCCRPQRFDMVRGIPDLAPVVNSIQYVHDIQKATLEKAKMDAFNAWFIGSTNNVGPGNLGPRSASKGVDGRTLEFNESGKTYYGRPGEEPKSLASNTPNPQYMAFMEKSLRIIGSALGLPYEFILLDFSQGSYSSSRAALLQTYRTFTDWQEWLTSCFLQRVWNWRIAKAVKEKQIPKAPISKNGVSEWYKVEWSFPEFGWVDPQNEAQANLLEWQLCTNTVTQMNRKKGRDIEDVMKEKGMELAMAQRIADQVNADMGTSFSWRDIISAQIPGQTASVASASGSKENAEDDNNNDDEVTDEASQNTP